MLDFGKFKTLRQKIEESTDDYLEHFLQTIFNEACQLWDFFDSSDSIFFVGAHFPEDFGEHIPIEADPQSMLHHFSFNIEFHYSSKLIIQVLDDGDIQDNSETFTSYLVKNGFFMEKASSGNRFVKMF